MSLDCRSNMSLDPSKGDIRNINKIITVDVLQ